MLLDVLEQPALVALVERFVVELLLDVRGHLALGLKARRDLLLELEQVHADLRADRLAHLALLHLRERSLELGKQLRRLDLAEIAAVAGGGIL